MRSKVKFSVIISGLFCFHFVLLYSEVIFGSIKTGHNVAAHSSKHTTHTCESTETLRLLFSASRHVHGDQHLLTQLYDSLAAVHLSLQDKYNITRILIVMDYQ